MYNYLSSSPGTTSRSNTYRQYEEEEEQEFNLQQQTPTNSSSPRQNNTNNSSTTNSSAMSSPSPSSASNNNNNGSRTLEHGLKKWIRKEGISDSSSATPSSSPFSHVTFNMQLTAVPGSNNNNNNSRNNNNNNNNNNNMITLVNSMDDTKPLDATLGITRIFKGLEIALRSMSVGEHSFFQVPEEMGHYYGVHPKLPPRCKFEMDLKLIACENATTLPKLPMSDMDPFKIIRQNGPDPVKRAYFGSQVDLLFQECDKVSGTMGRSKKLSLNCGHANLGPDLDMMVMSMCEREISTFILKNPGYGKHTFNPRDFVASPRQYSLTILKVTPAPAIPVSITPAMLMKVYDPSMSNEDSGVVVQSQQQNQQQNQQMGSRNASASTGGVINDENSSSSPSALGSRENSSAIFNRLLTSETIVDVSNFSPQQLDQTISFLENGAKKLFVEEQFIVATWFYAAASVIVRQRKDLSMDDVNKTLARYARNMGRCAYKQKRFSDALQLARECYAFDNRDAKGAFLLAQCLRENDSLDEAGVILEQVGGMPDTHSESFDAECLALQERITAKSAPPSAPASPDKQVQNQL